VRRPAAAYLAVACCALVGVTLLLHGFAQWPRGRGNCLDPGFEGQTYEECIASGRYAWAWIVSGVPVLIVALGWAWRLRGARR
jgi:hypothetical protein